MSLGVVFVAIGFGGVLAIVVVVVIVWVIGGGVVPSTGSNGGQPSGSGCEYCKKLDSWWAGLTDLQKVGQGGWYSWKKMDCYVRGCPTH